MNEQINLNFEDKFSDLAVFLKNKGKDPAIVDRLKTICGSDQNTKNKRMKLGDHWIRKGIEFDEEKFKKAFEVIEANINFNDSSKINLFNITSLNQIFEFNKNNKTKKQILNQYNPDKEPCFTNKVDVSGDSGHKVIVYEIQDDFNGLIAARRAINETQGVKFGPWRLLQYNKIYDDMFIENLENLNEIEKNKQLLSYYDKNNLKKAFDNWNIYKKTHKYICFKDGKVVAFCANKEFEILWFNEKNYSYDLLSEIIPGVKDIDYKIYTNKELLDKKLKEFKYNEETERYDYDGDLRIEDYFINEDGYFVVPIGKVNGNFDCSYNENLTSLKNGPIEVNGNYFCYNCNLVSLSGIPKIIKYSFDCSYNKNLSSLENGPIKVNDNYFCNNCNLSTLIGAPKIINKSFYCYDEKKIKFSSCRSQ